MKYIKNDGTIIELNYVLKIYFDTPKFYAVEPITFEDEGLIGGEIEITEGLMDIPTSTFKEIDVKECKLSNNSISVDILNKDTLETQYLYNALNSSIQNLYKIKASIFIAINGIINKEFSGFITEFNGDVYETKINLKIDDTREIFSQSIFEDLLSVNNSNVSKLNEVFNFELRTKDRGYFYTVDSSSDILLLANIKEGDGVFVNNESKYYVNKSGYNTNISDDWDFKKELDIQKIIVFGNHATKNRITDLIKGLLVTIFDNDETELPLYIDTSSFLISNYDESKDVPVYYEFYEKIDNTFDFIQDELLKYLNAYPIIDNYGKLKLIRQKQPSIAESVITINEDNIISVNKNLNDFSNIITNINIKSDYDFKDEKFKTELENFQSENVSKFGKLPKKAYEYEIKFDKNMSEIEKSTFKERLANNLFERFNDKLKTLNFDIFFSLNTINEGDYIKLVHSKLINWEGTNIGKRGIIDDVENPNMLINNNEQWGDFTGNSKNNSIGYLNGFKVIKVDRDVNVTFFNNNKSIAYNHFETKLKIPSRFYVPKLTGTNQVKYGEIKWLQY